NDAPSGWATSDTSSARSFSSVAALGDSTTNAQSTSPFISSGTPIAAASTTDGCETSADSTSAGPSLFPAILMVSSLRPWRNQLPSSSVDAQSPGTHAFGHRPKYVSR